MPRTLLVVALVASSSWAATSGSAQGLEFGVSAEVNLMPVRLWTDFPGSTPNDAVTPGFTVAGDLGVHWNRGVLRLALLADLAITAHSLFAFAAAEPFMAPRVMLTPMAGGRFRGAVALARVAPYFEVGLRVGVAWFFPEDTGSQPFLLPMPGLGAGVEWSVSDRYRLAIGFRLELAGGRDEFYFSGPWRLGCVAALAF